MPVRKGLFLPLILFLFLQLLPAQDVDLRLRSSYGFDGIVKAGHWNPLSITLSNLGDAVAGTLSIRVIVSPGSPNNETLWESREELQLGKGESVSRRYIVPVARGSLPIRLTYHRDGLPILQEEILPPLRYAPEELIVALSSGPIPRARGLSVAYPLMEHLPDRWQGYSGVDLLLISDPPLRRISPPQWYALREWISFGGTALIIESAPDVTRLWSDGGAISSRGPLLSRPFGDGLLLLDTNSDEALLPALRRVLSRRHSSLPRPPLENSRRPFADSGTAAIVDPAVYHFPSRWLMALVFLITLVSLTLLTRGEEKTPRMSRLGPLLVPAALALILGLILSTSAAPPEDVAAEVQLLRKDRETGMSMLLEREVLLMSSQERDYRVAVPEELLLLPNAGRANRIVPTRDGGSAVNGELDKWGRVYLGTWERFNAALSAELLPTEGALRIENGTDFVLLESALVTSWHTFPTGAVSPGQVVTRSLSEKGAHVLSLEARRYVNELRKSRLLREQLRDGVAFVGWSPQLAEPLSITPGFASRVVRGAVLLPLKGEVPR